MKEGLEIPLRGKRDKNCWWIGGEIREGEKSTKIKEWGKAGGKLEESCGNQN